MSSEQDQAHLEARIARAMKGGVEPVPNCPEHPTYPLYLDPVGRWWCRRGQHYVEMETREG